MSTHQLRKKARKLVSQLDGEAFQLLDKKMREARDLELQMVPGADEFYERVISLFDSTPGILCLPPELLLIIVDYMNSVDQLAMARTCRTLRLCVGESGLNITFKNTSKLQRYLSNQLLPSSNNKFIPLQAKDVTIDISSVAYTAVDSVLRDRLRAASTSGHYTDDQCRFLKTLETEACDAGYCMLLLIGTCPRLVRLRIRSFGNTSYLESAPLPPFPFSTALKALYIHSTDIEWPILRVLPHLEQLEDVSIQLRFADDLRGRQSPLIQTPLNRLTLALHWLKGRPLWLKRPEGDSFDIYNIVSSPASVRVLSIRVPASRKAIGLLAPFAGLEVLELRLADGDTASADKGQTDTLKIIAGMFPDLRVMKIELSFEWDLEGQSIQGCFPRSVRELVLRSSDASEIVHLTKEKRYDREKEKFLTWRCKVKEGAAEHLERLGMTLESIQRSKREASLELRKVTILSLDLSLHLQRNRGYAAKLEREFRALGVNFRVFAPRSYKYVFVDVWNQRRFVTCDEMETFMAELK